MSHNPNPCYGSAQPYHTAMDKPTPPSTSFRLSDQCRADLRDLAARETLQQGRKVTQTEILEQAVHELAKKQAQ